MGAAIAGVAAATRPKAAMSEVVIAALTGVLLNMTFLLARI
ncbi:hypothetical protein [Nonomuraea wenchangensis]